MLELTIKLSDKTVTKLKDVAEKMGITPEDLLKVSIEGKLLQIDKEFDTAVDYVLDKNSELYRRLAQ